jgi:hypothetical protein
VLLYQKIRAVKLNEHYFGLKNFIKTALKPYIWNSVTSTPITFLFLTYTYDMKRFKYFYFILLLWLCLFGNAYAKSEPILRTFTTGRTYTKVQIPYVKTLLKEAGHKLQYCKPYKNARLKSDFFKEIKRKATSPDSDIFTEFYTCKFVTIRSFQDNKIHGLSVLYRIKRHLYLHLYQLF